MAILIKQQEIDNKKYYVLDPNVFIEGNESVLLEPNYPVAPNVLDALLRRANNNLSQGKAPFNKINIGYNSMGAFMAHAIVDNKIKVLKALFLVDKYIDTNLNILNHDKTSFIGKPLDIAVNSVLRSEDLNMVMFLLKQGARSDNVKDLIKTLEIKATRSTEENLSFRCLVASNLLKVMNGTYEAEYIEKTISLHQLAIEGEDGHNYNVEKDLKNAENALSNLDKLSNETLDNIKKTLTYSLKERVFFEEKLNGRINTSLDLMTNNKNDTKYSLLQEDDSTMIKYPRTSVGQTGSGISQENWDFLEKNIERASLLQDTFVNNFSKNLIKFLIYQSMEDLEKIDRMALDENIDYTDKTKKEHLQNLFVEEVEKIKEEIEDIQNNQVILNYNNKLPKNPNYEKDSQNAVKLKEILGINFEEDNNIKNNKVELEKEINREIDKEKNKGLINKIKNAFGFGM